jgi:FixJ family two-component response regulator
VSDAPLILIVDDDRSVRESLKMLFESIGFAADIYDSAEELLASGHLPDSACLILDVRLPGMSGLDLQSRLKVEGSRIPVIFITAHPDERARRQALGAGAAAFFHKPFSSGALLDAVREVGSREES